MKRSLSLKRETLADLTPEQLTAVVGGALPTTPADCLEDLFDTLQATRCFCP